MHGTANRTGLTRRGFLGGSTALCGLSCIGGATSPDARVWRPGELKLHFIHTGAAESTFMVFPDGTSALLDCGGYPAINRGRLAVPVLPDGSRHSGEWIARYVLKANPKGPDVDYMLVSHFHADHAGMPGWCRGHAPAAAGSYALSGFAEAAQWLHFKVAIDRGWPDYRDPMPSIANPDVLGLMKSLYAHLKRRDGLTVEKIRLGDYAQIVPRHGGCEGFSVRTICANGRIATKDGSIRDVFGPHAGRCTTPPENAMSIGHVLKYGGFTFFTAGDFCDVFREKGRYVCFDDDLADAVGHADVAKVNHHGCDSMSRKLVAALSPRVWTAGVWDQLHMSPTTMGLLSDRAIYPGDRMIAPGVFTADRRLSDAGRPWMGDIAEETFGGAHVVVSVPPGGREYTVAFLDAGDEAAIVKGEYRFRSGTGERI